METFSYTEVSSRLDEMSKELEDLTEQMLKTQVKCHILGVELCTQFNPYVLEAVHNTNIECEKCEQNQQQMKESLLTSDREQEEEEAITTFSCSQSRPICEPGNQCNKTNQENSIEED